MKLLVLCLYFSFVISKKYIVTLHSHHSLQKHIHHYHNPSHIKHQYSHGMNGYSLRTRNRTLIRQLKHDKNVKSIELDQKVSVSAIQKNPPSWGIDRIDQQFLPLDYTYHYNASDGTGVTAYILDTGINEKHQEFQGRASWGANFVTNTNIDDAGHGTHVAGTIGGLKVGVSKNVSLVAVKVMDENGDGELSTVLAGLDWVISQQNRNCVINFSLSGILSPALDQVVSECINKNIVFVAAAGNFNQDACLYSPASIPEAVIVGASTSNDEYSDYSNYGLCVDIVAPGDDIYSTYNQSNQSYAILSGTSMSCPHVVGVVTQLKTKYPSMTVNDIKNLLINNSSKNKVCCAPTKTTEDLLFTDSS